MIGRLSEAVPGGLSVTTIVVLAIVLMIAIFAITVAPVVRVILAVAGHRVVSFGSELRWNAPFMVFAEVTMFSMLGFAVISFGVGPGAQPGHVLLWLLCLVSPAIWWVAAAALSAYLTREASSLWANRT